MTRTYRHNALYISNNMTPKLEEIQIGILHCARSGEEDTLRLQDALKRQGVKNAFIFINGDYDGLRRFTSKFHYPYLLTKTNVGFSAGVNAVLEAGFCMRRGIKGVWALTNDVLVEDIHGTLSQFAEGWENAIFSPCISESNWPFMKDPSVTDGVDIPFLELTCPIVGRGAYFTLLHHYEFFLDPAFRLGWGVDYDLALRCVIHEISFYLLRGAPIVEHDCVSKTFSIQSGGREEYRLRATKEMEARMVELWGDNWHRFVWNRSELPYTLEALILKDYWRSHK